MSLGGNSIFFVVNGSKLKFVENSKKSISSLEFEETRSGPETWLYDNSDQRRIRTENQIRTKDKFGPNFEIRPKLFR